MMDREAFVAGAEARWKALEGLLASPRLTAAEWTALASGYRGVAADLARARSHHLAPDIVRYLDELAGRAHNRLYSSRLRGGLGLVRMVAVDFPREARAQWRVMLAAGALFYVPFFAAMALCAVTPDAATLIVPADSLGQAELAYSSPEVGRSAGQDMGMAGFYVWNNVGIAFRCFATGALFGLGSVFYLVYNGMTIGAVAGYLGAVGLGGNLLAFVAGHSAWELTGVVVAGAAGLKMGWALVVTGGQTRAASLRAQQMVLLRLVVGATALLFMAALIEGFWSAGPFPFGAKMGFGAAQVGVVTAWLALGGRREDR